MKKKCCTWQEIEEYWETDCGNAFVFDVGGPTENKVRFCCYCGRKLKERRLMSLEKMASR